MAPEKKADEKRRLLAEEREYDRKIDSGELSGKAAEDEKKRLKDWRERFSDSIDNGRSSGWLSN